MPPPNKRAIASLTMAMVPALHLPACGDLAGTRSPFDTVGTLEVVRYSTLEPRLTPGEVTRTTASVMGTGGIGQARILSLEVTDAGTEKLVPNTFAIAPDGTALYLRSGTFIRVAPDDSVTVFETPNGMRFPGYSMVADHLNRLWCGKSPPEPGLARLDPATTVLTEFALPAFFHVPALIAVSPTGGLLLGIDELGLVGRVDSSARVFALAAADTATQASIAFAGIAERSDGEIFVSDFDRGRIGRIRDKGFVWTDAGGTSQGPSGMAAAPDDSIWFVAFGQPTQFIGRLDRDGNLRRYSLPADPELLGIKSRANITVGPDGAVWFTLPKQNGIGRLTPEGAMGFLHFEGAAFDLVFDARGRLWTTGTDIVRIEFGP